MPPFHFSHKKDDDIVQKINHMKVCEMNWFVYINQSQLFPPLVTGFPPDRLELGKGVTEVVPLLTVRNEFVLRV